MRIARRHRDIDHERVKVILRSAPAPNCLLRRRDRGMESGEVGVVEREMNRAQRDNPIAPGHDGVFATEIANRHLGPAGGPQARSADVMRWDRCCLVVDHERGPACVRPTVALRSIAPNVCSVAYQLKNLTFWTVLAGAGMSFSIASHGTLQGAAGS